MDTADALALKATIDQIVEALQACGDTQPLEQRQAAALGVLADPAAASALLNHTGDGMPTNRKATLIVHVAAESLPAGCFTADSLNPDTLDRATATPGGVRESEVPGTPGAARGSGVPGVPGTAGVARVEQCGPLDTDTLARFLAGSNVVVRPVIDLNTIPAVDAYEIPAPDA